MNKILRMCIGCLLLCTVLLISTNAVSAQEVPPTAPTQIQVHNGCLDNIIELDFEEYYSTNCDDFIWGIIEDKLPIAPVRH